METTTRRHFAKALVAAPVMAAGAFTLHAQDKAQLCCTTPSQAEWPPVAAHIHSELLTLYREFQHEDTQRVDGLRSLESTLRLWVAYAKETGTDQRVANALRYVNRNDAVAYVLREGQARSTAKFREVVPDYIPLDLQPLTAPMVEQVFNVLASGGYTQFLTKWHGYSERKLLGRMRRLGLVANTGLKASMWGSDCQSDKCRELQGDMAYAEAAIAILCGLCAIIPPECILCYSMVALRGWMQIQWAGQCVMMLDPEACSYW